MPKPMLVCTKKTIFLSFIILSLSFSLMAQRQIGPIAREVGEVFQNTAHSLVAPFKPSVRDAGQDERTRQIVHRGTLLELDTAILNQVLSEGPPALRLVVPRADGAELVLDLVATDPYAEGFRVFAASRRDIPADIDRGRHYRGIISGKLETLAAVSFHKGEMRGVIGTGQGDLVIGKLGGVGNKKNYILYNDYDLKVLPNSVCAADSLPPLPQNREPENELERSTRATSKCVNVYVEVDHDIYLEKGSLQASLSFMSGLFNEVATLYANDTITVAMSEMVIWDVSSPYNCSTSSNCLSQFTAATGSSFNGDLAHLVSYRASGGIAYINVLCNTYYAKSFSSVQEYYRDVPTYSWSVEVFAHEMGHNLGSKHTHACAWNGNSTQIDDCGNKFYDDLGFTPEGAACYNSNSPIIPSSGTIMSYCHLLSGVGIDLNNGFGPQPKSLIQNKINSGSCLSTCNGYVDTFYCFSTGISSTYMWISSVSVDTFTNASSVDIYSDFSDIGPAAEPGSTLTFTLTPSYYGGTYNTYYNIWIDFNHDLDFDDAGEQVYSFGPSANAHSGTFSIPDSATLGMTRMRIALSNTSVSSACQPFSNGEVEEYAFFVVTDPCTTPDTLAPTANCQDITVCLDGTGAVSISPHQIDDGSSDFCSDPVILSLSPTSFSCLDMGIQPTELIVTDSSGNTDTCQAFVTIEDCTAPTVTCQDLTLCLDDSGNLGLVPGQILISATDVCDDTPLLSLSQSTFSCTDVGTQSVSLIAEDDSGNTDSCLAALTIQDCTEPVITCQDMTICLDGSGNLTLSPAQITATSSDACDSNLEFSLSQTVFTCQDLGMQTASLFAEDDAGLRDTCSALVTIQDCTAPTITCQDITVCLDSTGVYHLLASEILLSGNDACDSLIDLAVSVATMSCADIGDQSVSLVAEDNVGNRDSCLATVTIEDCEGACPLPCPDTLLMNSDTLHSGTWQAAAHLESASIFLSGDTAVLSAGQTITLTPGFHAQTGSNVHIFINACDTTASLPVDNTPLTHRSNPQSRSELNSGSTLTVFPNPFSNKAIVRYTLSEPVSGLHIAVYDLAGRPVRLLQSAEMMAIGSYELTLNADGIQPGLYLLVMRGKGIRVIEKIVIGNQ